MINTSKQGQVIASPYRLASAQELQGCDDIGALSFQLRLFGVEQIRLIQAGKLDPHTAAQNLKDINQLLKEFGRPELSLDFLSSRP
ncbi:hypothetical protein BDD43_4422 [Mucilaginibacter gracilis]|uniref:Uncharacterized protein n=1 Tax=Mucilaginibacter gracilis TaxID=423350 RepID=A0A495J5F2_9SPHI|nr:hypothetical protein [Mucilaginibacter gracilis]RKR84195.1 hypothetical protein BDD43_4422 [Mucilaginibacter gracilis]